MSAPASRAEHLRAYFDRMAPDLPRWNRTNAYYYEQLARLLRTFIPPGSTVCEVGCGTAELLHALRPSVGVGIDASPVVVQHARTRYPAYTFYEGTCDVVIPITQAFAYVVLSDLVGYLEDIQASFENLRALCTDQTRVIITQYNRWWSPILSLAAFLRLKQPHPFMNWVSRSDVERLLDLAGFEVMHRGRRLLFPKRVPLLSAFCNRILAPLPGLNRLCVIEYVIARQRPAPTADARFRVSVVIPARDERGTVARIIREVPSLGSGTEIVFVEGHSTDGTREEIERCITADGGKRNIRMVAQRGRGKWDAVRTGFQEARGDILMVFDADCGVDPSALRKVYDVISTRRGEFVFGSRLLYPMERGAMQPFNRMMNWWFGVAVSRITGQQVTDAFCGVKALFARDLHRMTAPSWEHLDRYGDLTLFFGAATGCRKMVEVPVHYRARTYGASKMLRFREGWRFFRILLQMRRVLCA